MSSTKQNNSRRSAFSFAAIDSYLETNIVSPVEKVLAGRDMVEWGTRNAYPDYLLDLYNNVPTLRSIINGNIDYVAGDDVTIMPLQEEFTNQEMNMRGDTIREQVKDIAKDFEIYGGFALQVIRNLAGEVAEVYYIDMRYLRTNKEGDVFYYSEKWGKSSRTDMVVYPAPLYAASVKACEIERLIDEFHLSDINNHFVSSAIINFNNGDPGQEIKSEIERGFNEKFCGASNGGRVAFSWNPNKESATDIVEFKMEDFGERYKALSQHSRTQIFTSFRAIPLLFGLTSEANTGFSTEEFEQSFKLYNRTQIQPVQRMICDAYDKIYGQRGVLTIRPFSLGGDTEDNVN